MDHAREVSPIIGVFVFVSLIELPVVHLLIPWETVRLMALVASIWGLFWMVGLLASLRVFPHLVGERGIRVRSGTSIDFTLPWSAIADVRAVRGRVSSGKSAAIEGEGEAAALCVAMMKQTKVAITLREPTDLAVAGETHRVGAVHLYADDARAFAAAAQTRLAGV